MERIYTDTYDFAKLRGRGGVYVDKTALILRLIDGSIGTQFFLARPRRFGKSLLLSTIRYIFEGRRNLFDGLAIVAPEAAWDWEGERCPVIHLDMSLCSGTMEEVRESALAALESAARSLGLELARDKDLQNVFRNLVEDAAAASPTGMCVLLVDEYDKPLLQWLGTSEAAEYQAFLKRFYGVVKATEGLQRFCLMTGVSKFSKVSIFSDLNNLVDITMHPASTMLLGYTHDEVREYFPQALDALAAALCVGEDAAFDELVAWYDGYCFDEAMVPVFNPVSLGRTLADSRIRSYWFETGTPGWLMSFARRRPMMVDDVELGESALGTFDPVDPGMSALLFQTGYLTIKGVEVRAARRRYKLGFPNREVAEGFSEQLVQAYTGADEIRTGAWQDACWDAMQTGDAAGFVAALDSLLSSMGYDVVGRLGEQGFQAMITVALRCIGMQVAAEVTSAHGRADMVCQSAGHVFVIELKIASGDTAGQAAVQAAIAQIRERGYAAPFAADAVTGRRRVQLIGISFDCEARGIVAWECEDL